MLSMGLLGCIHCSAMHVGWYKAPYRLDHGGILAIVGLGVAIGSDIGLLKEPNLAQFPQNKYLVFFIRDTAQWRLVYFQETSLIFLK